MGIERLTSAGYGAMFKAGAQMLMKGIQGTQGQQGAPSAPTAQAQSKAPAQSSVQANRNKDAFEQPSAFQRGVGDFFKYISGGAIR